MTTYLPRDQQPPRPWKNGGGVTRTLAVSPAGAGIDTFDWRLSAADIDTDGPFSPFPGIDRVLVLLRGTDLVLTVDGHDHPLTHPGDRLAFPGEAAVHGRLQAGPTWDLNVMVRRGRVQAQVDVRSGGFEADGFVVGLGGSITVDGRALQVGDLAWGDGMGVEGTGRVVHIQLDGPSSR